MGRKTVVVALGMLMGVLVGTIGLVSASGSPDIVNRVAIRELKPRITGDYISVRPVKGPGGTEVKVQGYVAPGNCGGVGIYFHDRAGRWHLADVPGGNIDVTVHIPAGVDLGTGQVEGDRFYHRRPHVCALIVGAQAPFTVTNGPGIFGFSPRSGPVGAQVTIIGVRFIGTVAVKFNGTPSAFTVDSDSQITATVSQGATTGPIEVDVHPSTGSVLVQAISGPDFRVT